ncbi:hypothetical protein, partial [Achromobacter xylosoxidans]|uniref:hypothetical protein n=1 Tax=Alcaligenes xylosoxydans xylosoxydans TaxID=85698 RepID=UPI001F130F68
AGGDPAPAELASAAPAARLAGFGHFAPHQGHEALAVAAALPGRSWAGPETVVVRLIHASRSR